MEIKTRKLRVTFIHEHLFGQIGAAESRFSVSWTVCAFLIIQALFCVT
jgi:hypothetical protein